MDDKRLAAMREDFAQEYLVFARMASRAAKRRTQHNKTLADRQWLKARAKWAAFRSTFTEAKA